jgi:Bacterial regulatory proteins, luxR family
LRIRGCLVKIWRESFQKVAIIRFLPA